LLALGAGLGPVQAGLDVGDPAPAFTITNWLKGQPQDLATAKGKNIFVLDFWATWCAPCLQEIPRLTQLQAKYADQGVVVIGVTGPARGQQLSQVTKFLAERGDAMGYTVAWDQADQMWANYLAAAGGIGIPYLFLIDKDGRIAWHGIASPDMERVLDALIAGTYNVDEELRRRQVAAKVEQTLPRFGEAVGRKDWPTALAVLDEVLVADPTHERAIYAAYQIRVNETHDRPAARRWAEGFIEKNKDNAAALLALTRFLLTVEEPGNRAPDLLLRAAQRAYELRGAKDADAAAIYARAAHHVGRLDEAVRVLTEALPTAPESRKTQLQEALEFYQTCQQLRDTKFGS